MADKKISNEEGLIKYSVIVHLNAGGRRGFVVSVDNPGLSAVIEKLRSRIDLDMFHRIDIAEVYMEEDDL